MSKQTDFFELLSLLWDIEQFDMWYPKEHVALAYLIDRSYGRSDYQQRYANWVILAKQKAFNELAWSFSQTIYEEAKQDSMVPAKTLKNVERFNCRDKERYEKKKLSSFGNINKEYAPDWFWEIFGSYMELEKLKRENAVKAYMREECKLSPKQALENYKKLERHFDLLNELYFYVRHRRFRNFYPQTAEGITAKQLHKKTCRSALEAYNYLIYLRESPDEALKSLEY